MGAVAATLSICGGVALAALAFAGCDGKAQVSANKVVAEPGLVDPSICDSFVSPHWAGKYFIGQPRVAKSTKITPEVVDCDIRFGEARIQIQCGAKVNDAAALGMARQQYSALGTAVPGLGQLAYMFSAEELQFWDDDSTCTVRVRSTQLGANLVPAAQAVAAELGPLAVSRAP